MNAGAADNQTHDKHAMLRHLMVEEQLRSRGIRDARVLAAMEKVPRHLFVPDNYRDAAYEDTPLPIGLGQTISQPFMVAKMTELLELSPTDRVLEVGTGSGYQAAILGELAGEVWTVERHAELAQKAASILAQLGYQNVHVEVGDGTLGLPAHAPFNAIIVTAAAPKVPPALLDQLAINGRMVIPVSAGYAQDLILVEKFLNKETGQVCIRETSVLSCVFVPLIGKQGYQQ